MLLHWILSALALLLVSRVVPGFVVSGLLTALIAAVVIGFINATVGLIVKIVTLPLTILTLGIFWLIINAVMIELASLFVPGFHILSFSAAFWGSIVLSVVNMIIKALTYKD